MIPLGAGKRRVLLGHPSGLPRGEGYLSPLAMERIACARARVPDARHPGGATFHRSGSAMGAAPGVSKRYLVRCAHKIGCFFKALAC